MLGIMARGVGLLVSTIVIGAMALLAGCAARQPWERDWPRPGSSALREEPYLWCGLEPAEMARRLVGAFPLGSSRAKIEATITRLHLDELLDPWDQAAINQHVIQTTTAGSDCPTSFANADDVVLHLSNWAGLDSDPIGRWLSRHTTCRDYVCLHFESGVLRAVELRQYQFELFGASASAALERWRAAARQGVAVFTYGVPEDR